MTTDPKFTSGQRVLISSIGEIKIVVRAYVYKGGPEWAYELVDEAGVPDEGWREDELQPA